MISFKNYYLQQIKDVPGIWKLAKKHKKYKAFLCSVSLLFFPQIIYTMWLYDTGQMKIVERYPTLKTWDILYYLRAEN